MPYMRRNSKRCRCYRAAYCDRCCQERHWRLHRDTCLWEHLMQNTNLSVLAVDLICEMASEWLREAFMNKRRGIPWANSLFNIGVFKGSTRPLYKKYTASFREVHGVSINRILHFYDLTKSFHNCIFWLKLNPSGCGNTSWMWNTSGDMVGSFGVNMDLGGCSRSLSLSHPSM